MDSRDFETESPDISTNEPTVSHAAVCGRGGGRGARHEGARSRQ